MPSVWRSLAAGVADAAGLRVDDHPAAAGEGLPEGGVDSLAGRGGLSAARLGCAWVGAAARVCIAGTCGSAIVEPETGGAAALVAAPLADTAALALVASGIGAAGLARDRLGAGIAIAAAVAAAAGVAGAAVVTTTGAAGAARLASVPAPSADRNDAAACEAAAGAAAWAEPGAGDAAA